MAKKFIIDHKKDSKFYQVFVAKNNEDAISFNWMLEYQWIDMSYVEPLRSLLLPNYDGAGFYFKESSDYALKHDTYSELLFIESDAVILDKLKGYLNKLSPIMNEFQSSIHSYNNFENSVEQNKNDITSIYFEVNDLSLSKNLLVEDLRQRLIQIVSLLDDLRLWVARNDLSEKQREYFSKKRYEDAAQQYFSLKETIKLKSTLFGHFSISRYLDFKKKSNIKIKR